MRNFYIITTSLLLLLTSCGHLFNHTNFHVPLDGEIAIDREVQKTQNGYLRLKYKTVKQLEFQRPGYKTLYKVWYGTRYNVMADVELFVIPIVAGMGMQSSDGSFGSGVLASWPFIVSGISDKINGRLANSVINFQGWKYPDFSESKSKMKILECIVDKDSAFAVKNFYSNANAFSKNKISYFESLEQNDFYSADSLEDWSNSFLYELNVMDTNTLNISGYSDYQVYTELMHYKLNIIKTRKKLGLNWKKAELKMKYKVFNDSGQLVYEKAITSYSGEFIKTYPDKHCLQDALNYSVLHFLDDPEIVSLLNSKIDYKLELDESIFTRNDNSKDILNYDELSKSILKYETEFGSAPVVPVAQKGYVAISRHAYDLSDTPLILSPIGDTMVIMGVIQSSFLKDYIILQLDTSFTNYYSVKASNSNLNQTITAVGFAKYIDVLSMVEGSMSAKRMEKEYPLYQLDIGISNMVYPALFSDDGYLLGFVSRTVKSRSAEGMSFYRPLLDGQ